MTSAAHNTSIRWQNSFHDDNSKPPKLHLLHKLHIFPEVLQLGPGVTLSSCTTGKEQYEYYSYMNDFSPKPSFPPLM